MESIITRGGRLQAEKKRRNEARAPEFYELQQLRILQSQRARPSQKQNENTSSSSTRSNASRNSPQQSDAQRSGSSSRDMNQSNAATESSTRSSNRGSASRSNPSMGGIVYPTAFEEKRQTAEEKRSATTSSSIQGRIETNLPPANESKMDEEEFDEDDAKSDADYEEDDEDEFVSPEEEIELKMDDILIAAARAGGWTTKKIAQALNISAREVIERLRLLGTHLVAELWIPIEMVTELLQIGADDSETNSDNQDAEGEDQTDDEEP